MAQQVKEIANLMEERIEYYIGVIGKSKWKLEANYLKREVVYKEIVQAEAVLEILNYLYNTSINIVFDIEDEIELKEKKQKAIENNFTEDQHTAFEYLTYIRYEAQLDELYRLRSRIKSLYDFDL
ncbi:hypothetical protein BCB4_0038 [Bacillus phage B4]|uniref:Uncharacterized protein n=2 Tax=Bequatrovirus B4 TaxID=1918005 RepID=J9PQS5_9CAUD|nr:hypothetical protein BCB4_0038 [Bacillus phage B4]YP_009783634.1 hypothetical protein QLX26_gp038 [Bacillus phage B5S]AEW47272.1 hypothetical protein B5S_0038 [Bacillus phage B5S]AEZ65831.1 hypothetical protein BCB4_0038 [Bacillus phage B4]